MPSLASLYCLKIAKGMWDQLSLIYSHQEKTKKVFEIFKSVMNYTIALLRRTSILSLRDYGMNWRFIIWLLDVTLMMELELLKFLTRLPLQL